MIDAHAHVFDTAARSPRGVDRLVPADRSAPVEEFLAILAAHGVEQAVLVPLDEHDDYVAQAVAAHPGRFAAVAVAGNAERGLTGADPVDSLRRRRERLPFSAVRSTWLADAGTELAESPMYRVLEWCQEEDICLWSYLPPDQFPRLDEVARRLPGLRIVLNHFGFTPHDMRVDDLQRPLFDERLPEVQVDRVCALAAHDSISVMISGHYALSGEEAPFADLAAPTRRYLDAFGAGRLLWGSDMPWPAASPGYAALIDSVDNALPGLGAADRDRLFGGTACELLRFV